MKSEFQKEYREKAGELIGDNSKKLRVELEGLIDRIEFFLNQAVGLDNIQSDKFKNPPKTKDEWEEYAGLTKKIEEKYEKAEALREEIDKILHGIPKNKIEEELRTKLEILRKNIAAKYPSKN